MYTNNPAPLDLNVELLVDWKILSKVVLSITIARTLHTIFNETISLRILTST